MTDRELLEQAHYVIKDFLLCVDEDCGVESCDECKPYRHAWDVEQMIRERLSQPEQKPLTNAQIDSIVDWPDFVKASMVSGIHLTDHIIALVRAVEAAHNIGEMK